MPFNDFVCCVYVLGRTISNKIIIIVTIKWISQQAKGKMPSLSLHEPLLFREFFFLMGCTNPSLHKMADNPVSCQYPWEENPDGLRRWKEVCTHERYIQLARAINFKDAWEGKPREG